MTETELLLKWFDKNGRRLPWRHIGGAHPNPYHVLVSEFMLQQTTVATVGPYFARFLDAFPTIRDLATATEERVYALWAGLGYYSRARSLHKTAKIIVDGHNGVVPDDRAALLKLPGIGPYTTASILSLAYDRPEPVVDGNVVRVVCRLNGWDAPTITIMDKIRDHAAMMTSPTRPADYASAIMDFGATVCTPKNPTCDTCPLRESCVARRDGTVDKIPVILKLEKKEKLGRAYLIRNHAGQIWIRRRPGRGLLAGLYEMPWTDDGTPVIDDDAMDTGITVTHTFTHFKLTLELHVVECDAPDIDGQFINPDDWAAYPTSTLMDKAFRAMATAGLL